MINDPFQQALDFTLAQEGGWTDNPADPGGPTMHGITLAVFRTWRHDPALKAVDLRSIEMAEVAKIYRALYWNPVGGMRLPVGAGLSVFDAAVNLGIRRATLLLQATVVVAQDGAVGPATLNAADQMNISILLDKLASMREDFYRCCADFNVFGNGWLSRNQACLAAARRAAELTINVPLSESPTQKSNIFASPTADNLNSWELTQMGVTPLLSHF